MDKLTQLIEENLSNAVDNGYDVKNVDPAAVIEEMMEQTDLPRRVNEILVEIVAKWQKKQTT